jgi:hypothetical protein
MKSVAVTAGAILWLPSGQDIPDIEAGALNHPVLVLSAPAGLPTIRNVSILLVPPSPHRFLSSPLLTTPPADYKFRQNLAGHKVPHRQTVGGIEAGQIPTVETQPFGTAPGLGSAARGARHGATAGPREPPELRCARNAASGGARTLDGAEERHGSARGGKLRGCEGDAQDRVWSGSVRRAPAETGGTCTATCSGATAGRRITTSVGTAAASSCIAASASTAANAAAGLQRRSVAGRYTTRCVLAPVDGICGRTPGNSGISGAVQSRKLKAARSGTTREDPEGNRIGSYTVTCPAFASTTAVLFHFQLKPNPLDLEEWTKLGSWTVPEMAGRGGREGWLLCYRWERFMGAVPTLTEGNMGRCDAGSEYSARGSCFVCLALLSGISYIAVTYP